MLSSRPDFGWHGALSATVREATISAIVLPEQEDGSGGPVEVPELAKVEALRLLGLLEAGDGDSEDLLRGFSEAEVALLKEWLGRFAQGTARTPSVRPEEYDMDGEE